MPAGPVLHADDARAARPGTDYTVVTTQESPDLEIGGTATIKGVTDDGSVLLVEGPAGIDDVSHLTLVDPTTGQRDELPDPEQSLDRVIALGADRLVFESTFIADRPAIVSFDRVSRQWSRVSLTGLPPTNGQGSTVIFRMRLGGDGRAYLAIQRDLAVTVFDLWSVSLDGPHDFRDERLEVGNFDTSGTELTWIDSGDQSGAVLHTRDLATGAQTDVDPESGRGCNQLALQRTPSYVVLEQYCGEVDGRRDDRVQVVAADGSAVATIQGDGFSAASGNDTAIVVEHQGGDVSAAANGTYVYDVASGDLVRVSEGIAPFDLGGPVPAPYALWQTPINERAGAVQTLATWGD